MIWFVYNLLFPLAFLLMLPKFLSRMARRGGYKKHFEQRFGIYGQGISPRFEETRRIWIHAVSVGEIRIALRFIDEARKADSTMRFVLSTNTSTAHAIGNRELDPCDVLIYFPLDIPFIIKRAFNAIQPLKLILVECEIWPNLIREANRRGIPVALINGRLSDSSFRGYTKLRAFTRRLLPLIDPICVQGRRDAERMISLGARPETVTVVGTAKYDLPPPAADAASPARAVLNEAGVPDDALILLGGSTWPGEEEVLCATYKKLRTDHPDLFLVLVPRHAERREEVVNVIHEQGLSCSLRSQGAEPADVLVIDTTGELMSFYAAADVVFVGKSLCNHGGQNPIEPALFGKSIIVGPNMENFPAVMDDFLLKSALCQVQDVPALEQNISKLLADSSARAQLGRAAAELVESRRGAVSRMVELIR
jgi:3-deoxy-D-manno-octulosonic-acid transferase